MSVIGMLSMILRINRWRPSMKTVVMRLNLQDIYQERELVLVLIKVGLILFRIKL